jgi:hypothetical protein
MPKHRTKSSSAKPGPEGALSFVTGKRDKNGKILRGQGRGYWSVKEIPKSSTPLLGGDYGADCEAGERRAEEFLRYLNLDRSATEAMYQTLRSVSDHHVKLETATLW